MCNRIHPHTNLPYIPPPPLSVEWNVVHFSNSWVLRNEVDIWIQIGVTEGALGGWWGWVVRYWFCVPNVRHLRPKHKLLVISLRECVQYFFRDYVSYSKICYFLVAWISILYRHLFFCYHFCTVICHYDGMWRFFTIIITMIVEIF